MEEVLQWQVIVLLILPRMRGFAVSIWGAPRSTIDVDVLVQLFEPKIERLHSEMLKISELSYLDKQTMEEEVIRAGEFNFIHGDSGIKFDFFVAGHNADHELELKRRIPVEIDGQKVYFLSPEDLILSKLRWYRESRSERQLEDIESVINRQKDIDVNYLEKQAKIQSTYEFLKPLMKI